MFDLINQERIATVNIFNQNSICFSYILDYLQPSYIQKDSSVADYDVKLIWLFDIYWGKMFSYSGSCSPF